MKLSEINDLLNSKLSLNSFKERNKDEFISFSSLQNKTGSSIPIILEEDISSLEINNSDVLCLCDFYIRGHLNNDELSYIVDALLLSEKVKVNDESLEILESMTDPSANGRFTTEEAQSIIDQSS